MEPGDKIALYLFVSLLPVCIIIILAGSDIVSDQAVMGRTWSDIIIIH